MIDAKEAMESPGQRFGRNAGSGVGDVYMNRGRLARGRHRHGSSRRSERNARNRIWALCAAVPIRRAVAAGHQHIDPESGASQWGRGQFQLVRDGAHNSALIQHRLAHAEQKLLGRNAIDHMASVPGAAGAIAGQARCVLRQHLVPVAAAVGAVVDLVRSHVIGIHQQAVGERSPHSHGETVIRAHADGAPPADG